MGLSPLAHALNIGRTAEVTTVGRLAQPSALTRDLASVTTPGLGAELLIPPLKRVSLYLSAGFS
jgi:hypothetical protein